MWCEGGFDRGKRRRYLLGQDDDGVETGWQMHSIPTMVPISIELHGRWIGT